MKNCRTCQHYRRFRPGLGECCSPVPDWVYELGVQPQAATIRQETEGEQCEMYDEVQA